MASPANLSCSGSADPADPATYARSIMWKSRLWFCRLSDSIQIPYPTADQMRRRINHNSRPIQQPSPRIHRRCQGYCYPRRKRFFSEISSKNPPVDHNAQGPSVPFFKRFLVLYCTWTGLLLFLVTKRELRVNGSWAPMV